MIEDLELRGVEPKPPTGKSRKNITLLSNVFARINKKRTLGTAVAKAENFICGETHGLFT